MAKLYGAGATVVHSGDVPHGNAWQQLTGNHGDKTVIHEEGSKNENWTDIAGAVALAGKPLTPGTTRVFNALPQEREHTVASQRERHRMGIGGSSQAWSDVNERIARETKGFRTEVAHKQALLDELQRGNASVIVVYAHFDGSRLYLPGAEGGTLSVDESAGARPGHHSGSLQHCRPHCERIAGVPSAAKGIARTVLATEHPNDARDIPELMARLRSGTPPRQAGGQLRQYVELNERKMFPGHLLRHSPEGEVSSGE